MLKGQGDDGQAGPGERESAWFAASGPGVGPATESGTRCKVLGLQAQRRLTLRNTRQRGIARVDSEPTARACGAAP